MYRLIPNMSYTDEQVDFIIDEKLKHESDWPSITKVFNEKFKTKKTSDSIRKTYDRYKNIPYTQTHSLDNLKTTHRVKIKNAKLAKDNKLLLNESVFSEDLKVELENVIPHVDFKLHKPLKLKKKTTKSKRTLVGHLSDMHYGCNISIKELGGINEYNNTVAARRTAFFFKQLCDYKPQHRKDTDLVLIINGDIMAGVIHDQEHGVDLITKQFATTLSILSQGISYVAQNFSKVTIYCTTGNHDRVMHKMSKSRATTLKWDSYATMVYVSLKNKFDKSYKNVNMIIPETPYCVMNIQGHQVLATHGDTVFNLGNPGKSINMENLKNQVNSISLNLLRDKLEDKISLVFAGHVHVPTVQMLDNGTYVFINGALSGVDGFAQSLGIFGNCPTQQIVEITPEHAVGDLRFIQVKEADQDKSLDLIIEPLITNF